MIIIVTFCALIWTLLQAGCSPSATEDRAVIADKVYACPGTIASGGMFGDDAEALCGTGYHVCTSAIEVESLGYTDEDCQAIVGQLEFFGTQETSDGSMRCFSHRGGTDRTKYNDIWGCAKDGSQYKTASLGWTWIDPCGELSGWIGQGDHVWAGGAWYLPADRSTWLAMEAIHFMLNDPTYGGVLCCVDSCATVGASYNPSHECQCQAECEGVGSGDRFCHAIDFVSSTLGEPTGQGYCATGTCCCSCSDCDGFTNYL